MLLQSGDMETEAPEAERSGTRGGDGAGPCLCDPQRRVLLSFLHLQTWF